MISGLMIFSALYHGAICFLLRTSIKHYVCFSSIIHMIHYVCFSSIIHMIHYVCFVPFRKRKGLIRRKKKWKMYNADNSGNHTPCGINNELTTFMVFSINQSTGYFLLKEFVRLCRGLKLITIILSNARAVLLLFNMTVIKIYHLIDPNIHANSRFAEKKQFHANLGNRGRMMQGKFVLEPYMNLGYSCHESPG